MKLIYIIGFILLALIVGFFISHYFITPHTTEIVNNTVYLVKECDKTSQNGLNELIEPSQREIDRLYYDEIIVERKELLKEYKEIGFPEIRKANHVPYCDRAGVVC